MPYTVYTPLIYSVLHTIYRITHLMIVFTGVRSKLLSRKHKSKGKSTRSKKFCDVDLGSDQESDTGRGAGRGLGVDKHSALDFKRLGKDIDIQS